MIKFIKKLFGTTDKEKQYEQLEEIKILADIINDVDCVYVEKTLKMHSYYKFEKCGITIFIVYSYNGIDLHILINDCLFEINECDKEYLKLIALEKISKRVESQKSRTYQELRQEVLKLKSD